MDPEILDLLPLPFQIAAAVLVMPLEVAVSEEEAWTSVLDTLPDVFPMAAAGDVARARRIVEIGGRMSPLAVAR